MFSWSSSHYKGEGLNKPTDVFISTLSVAESEKKPKLKITRHHWSNISNDVIHMELDLDGDSELLKHFMDGSVFMKRFWLQNRDSRPSSTIKYGYSQGDFDEVYSLYDEWSDIYVYGLYTRKQSVRYEITQSCHLTVQFRTPTESIYGFADLLTDICQHFEMSEQDKISLQQTFKAFIPQKNIIELAKSGNHEKACRFVTRLQDNELKLKLADYFQEIKQPAYTLTIYRNLFAWFDYKMGGLTYKRHGYNIFYREMIFRMASLLLNTRNDKQMTKEIKNALFSECKDANLLWELVQYFQEKREYHYAACAADKIPKENARFQEAHFILATMVLYKLVNTPNMSELEKSELKKLQFHHLLLATPKYQAELNREANEFCGNEEGSVVTSNVNLSFNTFYEMMVQIKKLNEENKRLKAVIHASLFSQQFNADDVSYSPEYRSHFHF